MYNNTDSEKNVTSILGAQGAKGALSSGKCCPQLEQQLQLIPLAKLGPVVTSLAQHIRGSCGETLERLLCVAAALFRLAQRERGLKNALLGLAAAVALQTEPMRAAGLGGFQALAAASVFSCFGTDDVEAEALEREILEAKVKRARGLVRQKREREV